MPEVAGAARTRKVKTISEEEVEIPEGESKGLGMPWQEYLAGIADDELAITTIYIYRKEPPTVSGFLARLGGDGQPAERIDEEWIAKRFGGGVYDLTIRSKSGKSHYERGVKIQGEPKLTVREQGSVGASATTAAAPGLDAGLARLTDLLDKTIDRLSTIQAQPALQPNPATSQVVEIMSSAAKEAVKIAGSGREAGGGDDLDKEFKRALIRKLLDGGDSNLDKDLERLKTLRDVVAPQTSAKSLVEQLKELGELRELLGWGKEAGKGDWVSLLIDKAPTVLDKLGEITASRAEEARERRRGAEAIAVARGAVPAAPAPSAALPTSANRSPAPSPAPMGSGLRLVPQGAETAPPAEVIPPTAPPANAAGLDTESEGFVSFVKQRIVEMIETGAEGEAIVDFLDGVKQHQFVEMLGRFSADQITQYLRQDPILVRAVEHPRWPDVLAQAQAYVRDEDAPPSKPARPN